MALCSARLLGRRPRVRLRPGSPHTTGSSARSLRHSRALSPLRTPRQGSSTATAHSSNSPCWRADYKDKATSLKQLQHRQSQPEMQTPPARLIISEAGQEKPLTSLPVSHLQLLKRWGIEMRCGRHHTTGCCSSRHTQSLWAEGTEHTAPPGLAPQPHQAPSEPRALTWWCRRPWELLLLLCSSFVWQPWISLVLLYPKSVV